MARLGMAAHITAPTIHSGIRGRVTLELYNFGPFEVEVRPNISRLCQLIIEAVSEVPGRGASKTFSD
jgi:dCTP deaminase